MAESYDCAPGRGGELPHVWAERLESALSVASASPKREHVETVRGLLRRVPDAGLTDEWRRLIGEARVWLNEVDAVPVPYFRAHAALEAAAAARPHPVHGWQRQHAAICGE